VESAGDLVDRLDKRVKQLGDCNEELEARVAQLERIVAQERERNHVYVDAIRRLMGQVVSLGGTPVYQLEE